MWACARGPVHVEIGQALALSASRPEGHARLFPDHDIVQEIDGLGQAFFGGHQAVLVLDAQHVVVPGAVECGDKTLPIDIQCCSQAIDTLVYFGGRDRDSLGLAVRVARWTIRHMQDSTGYFYYRRYAPWLANKTPTLHWGQATMLCALAGLYRAL